MICVIGVGNEIRSDDGLGVHAVRALAQAGAAGPGVELVEGGTAGLLLLPYLEDCERVLVLDAVRRPGAAPGTVHALNGDAWERALRRGTTVHELGVADLLAAARLRGVRPRRLAVLGAQPASTELGTELSPPVAAALEEVVARALAQLQEWSAPAQVMSLPASSCTASS